MNFKAAVLSINCWDASDVLDMSAAFSYNVKNSDSWSGVNSDPLFESLHEPLDCWAVGNVTKNKTSMFN
jgi:hypothetical protein